MTLSQEEIEFESILKEVTSDLFNAKYQSRLYWKINESMLEYEIEIKQSNAFWNTILGSLEQSAILSLSKAYDQNHQSIHLSTLLDCAIKNKKIFSPELFKIRVASRPFHDSFLEDCKIPSEEEILQDRKSISPKNSTSVKKLIQLRSNLIAHKNKGQILGHSKSINLLSWTEFDQLIEKGFEIRNRYSRLYDASIYLENELVGKDDYRYVFRDLKLARLVVDFVNFNAHDITAENCMEMNQRFFNMIEETIYEL